MTVYLYMCGVDWQHEIGPDNAGDTILYEDIDVLKKERRCTKECGIVKLEATLKEIECVVEQKL